MYDDAALEPWDDELVGSRLEATMGIAWAPQCLDPHPEVASNGHRQMSIDDLIKPFEKLQEHGLIGTISADIFETRQLVEEAAEGDPEVTMLYERAMCQPVDTAAWVLFNWYPALQTAGSLAQFLLVYQLDRFFDEVETTL